MKQHEPPITQAGRRALRALLVAIRGRHSDGSDVSVIVGVVDRFVRSLRHVVPGSPDRVFVAADGRSRVARAGHRDEIELYAQEANHLLDLLHREVLDRGLTTAELIAKLEMLSR